jgi:hypothetical protein
MISKLLAYSLVAVHPDLVVDKREAVIALVGPLNHHLVDLAVFRELFGELILQISNAGLRIFDTGTLESRLLTKSLLSGAPFPYPWDF